MRAIVPLMLLTGCGAAAQAPRAAREPMAQGACQLGPVTYYADELAGRATASGEPYEPGAMTGAHRSVPLGSWLRVTWKGREVRVRINDRGGPRGGVDLSKGAAARLGMLRAGRVQAMICGG